MAVQCCVKPPHKVWVLDQQYSATAEFYMAFPFLRGLLTQFPQLDRLRTSVIKMGQPVMLTSLAVMGLTVGLRAVGVFERSELAFYDQFIRFQSDRPPDERVVVVGINEVDLQTLQEWPISDLTMARLLEALQAYQPRVIGVDVLRDIPTGEGRDALIQQLQQPNVIVVCKVADTNEPGVPPPAELPRESVVFSDLVVDPGGILRRSLLFLNPPPPASPSVPTHACNTPDTLVSLSFGSALKYLEAANISSSFNEKNQLQIGSTLFPPITPNFGSYQTADAGGYQIMLRYRAEENSVPIINVMDVLNGQVTEEMLRDRIVLIGYTTPLAKDDFYTPYSVDRDDQQKMSGVIVHAQSTSQILSVVLDGQSLIMPWPLALNWAWIFGWTLTTGIFAWYVRHPAWFVSGVLLIGGTAYGIALALFSSGTWIPIFPALVSIGMASGGVVLVDRFNNSAYGRQVVKKVKTLLHIDIDQEKLEKQVSEITETDYFQELKSKAKTLRSRTANSQILRNQNGSQTDTSSYAQPNLTPKDEEAKPDADSDRPSFDPMYPPLAKSESSLQPTTSTTCEDYNQPSADDKPCS